MCLKHRFETSPSFYAMRWVQSCIRLACYLLFVSSWPFHAARPLGPTGFYSILRHLQLFFAVCPTAVLGQSLLPLNCSLPPLSPWIIAKWEKEMLQCCNGRGLLVLSNHLASLAPKVIHKNCIHQNTVWPISSNFLLANSYILI